MTGLRRSEDHWSKKKHNNIKVRSNLFTYMFYYFSIEYSHRQLLKIVSCNILTNSNCRNYSKAIKCSSNEFYIFEFLVLKLAHDKKILKEITFRFLPNRCFFCFTNENESINCLRCRNKSRKVIGKKVKLFLMKQEHNDPPVNRFDHC